MQEWQIAGRRGRKGQEGQRQIDPRLTSSLGQFQTRSTGESLPLSKSFTTRRQQEIESLARHRQILQSSQLLKAVQAAFQIAEADSFGEELDVGVEPKWELQKVDAFVIWGLGSFRSGAAHQSTTSATICICA